jgi:hypothetical protein
MVQSHAGDCGSSPTERMGRIIKNQSTSDCLVEETALCVDDSEAAMSRVIFCEDVSFPIAIERPGLYLVSRPGSASSHPDRRKEVSKLAKNGLLSRSDRQIRFHSVIYSYFMCIF